MVQTQLTHGASEAVGVIYGPFGLSHWRRLEAEVYAASSGNDAASTMFILAAFSYFTICGTSPVISFPFRDALCEYAELFRTKNAKYD